jgi:hypothetical protein
MYRFYKCIATNKLGLAEHRIHLREARKPDRVLQVIVAEKTATSISYKIVGPIYDGGLPVTSFIAQYKEDRPGGGGYGGGWGTIVGGQVSQNEAEGIHLKSWPADQQLFIVDGLTPLRTYFFRFAAENAVGVGEWAHERPEVMPRRSAPEPPPIVNEASWGGVANTPYPNKFELRWTVPPDNGERILAFEIEYQPVSALRIAELLPRA